MLTLLMTILLSCSWKAPVARTLPDVNQAIDIKPTPSKSMAEFKPGGSMCLDAIMAYYIDAECLSLFEYGDSLETGLYTQCVDAVEPTKFSEPLYFALTTEAVVTEAVDVSGMVPICADPWFSVFIAPE